MSNLVNVTLDMTTHYRDMVLRGFMDPKNNDLTCAELRTKYSDISVKVCEHVQMVIAYIEKTSGKTCKSVTQIAKLKLAIEFMQPESESKEGGCSCDKG